MVACAVRVIPNQYRDSVVLMQLSATLAKLPGVTQAFPDDNRMRKPEAYGFFLIPHLLRQIEGRSFRP